ncbi:MAG: electron transfer flavoprotein subunit beta/FixA family protein [Chloroflexi bacterium]|nr:electron transfer flavoprotein subunit beta/FixA family protein [Chloroflexota bacterium]MCL5074844.1 electron transfer flavoprotein subunit beta/FixA family protein [Chloroflexota bacterium]
MNIIVCIKQVPETAAEKRLNDQLRLDREAVENILNPFDEYAVEEALRIKENKWGTVTILCMGPESAKTAIRKAIAMGADKAVLVSDQALVGSDVLATAQVLSQALGRIPHDLILCGMQSTDAGTALVPAAIAELLGLPMHTYTAKLEIGDGQITTQRSSDQGYDVISSPLPALVAVIKGINEPRYPSLKGIMRSKQAEIIVWSLADIGLDASKVGSMGAKTKVVSFATAKPRQAGEVIKDDGLAAVKIVDFLAMRKII